jgi:hypothetical protein
MRSRSSVEQVYIQRIANKQHFLIDFNLIFFTTYTYLCEYDSLKKIRATVSSLHHETKSVTATEYTLALTTAAAPAAAAFCFNDDRDSLAPEVLP